MGAAGAGRVRLISSDLRGSDLELRVGEEHKSTGVRAASILVLWLAGAHRCRYYCA